MVDVKGEESFARKCKGCVTDKGHLALALSLLIILIGAVLVFGVDADKAQDAGRYFFSIGLFSFSGGVTNWIAIQMLFYKIPGIHGSGVLARRYKNIRRSMKDMILETFFTPDFLNKYIPEKLREAAAGAEIESKVNAFLKTEAGQEIIDEKIDQIASMPEGKLMESMDINVGSFKPLIKPVIISFLSDLGPSVMYHMIDPNNGTLNLGRLRTELDRYMCERMEEVTPQMIKDIMYVVVLQYLGWLIVWGCIFGCLMGVVCEATHLSPQYEYW